MDSIFIMIPFAVVILVFFLCNKDKKSTLQINRQKELSISAKPIVAIYANDIIVDRNMVASQETLEALQSITSKVTVFLFVVVKDQSEADALSHSMEAQFSGIIEPGHILYCQTPEGRASMARQLEAASIIDSDVEVLHLTANFFHGVLIAPPDVSSQYAYWQASSFIEFVHGPNISNFLNQRH